MRKKPTPTPDWAETAAALYWDERKTDRAIAQAVGVTPQTVRLWRMGQGLPNQQQRRAEEREAAKIKDRTPLEAAALEASTLGISYGQLMSRRHRGGSDADSH